MKRNLQGQARPPRLRRFLAEIYESEPVLTAAGWVAVVALALSLGSWPVDPRTVQGVSPWLQPLRFAVSITIYLWALAWYLRHLHSPERVLNLIRWGASGSMLVVMGCVWYQAARGVPLFYDTKTLFDGILFAVTVLMLILNNFVVVLVFVSFFTDADPLPPAYLWGIRFGLLLFALSGWVGMFMLVNLGPTLRAASGSGLPLVGWHPHAGDLRIPHLAGLYALELLPLIGSRLSRSRRLSLGWQTLAITVFFLAYSGAGFWLYHLALARHA